jgi:hypothetical protein
MMSGEAENSPDWFGGIIDLKPPGNIAFGFSAADPPPNSSIRFLER